MISICELLIDILKHTTLTVFATHLYSASLHLVLLCRSNMAFIIMI